MRSEPKKAGMGNHTSLSEFYLLVLLTVYKRYYKKAIAFHTLGAPTSIIHLKKIKYY